MARACFLALTLPLALVACSGNTTSPNDPSDPTLDVEENAVAQGLNTLRTSKGIAMVSVCTSLNVSASGHSDDMRNNDYLNDISPIDNSDVRSRGCKAGYSAACPPATIPMAELVALGYGTGAETLAQWAGDGTAAPILLNPQFKVMGVGRSIGAGYQKWTLDLASNTDPSCQ